MEDDFEIRWARQREAQFAESAARLAALTNLILPELCGGLWHITHPDRFKSILNSNAILPEPDIPEGARYCTGLGKDHYPYVRTLGGVSLFDFNRFDPDAYTEEYPYPPGPHSFLTEQIGVRRSGSKSTASRSRLTSSLVSNY